MGTPRGALARKIRKARRENVAIELARDLKAWVEYFEIYRDLQQRWGDVVGRPHAWPLFEIMQSRSSPNINLWLARADGRVVAGALCFSFAHHVVYWHGATRSEALRLRAANLLHAHIIQNACASGFWWYDFNPSGALKGVEAFKRSFGTVELGAATIIHENARRRTIEALKRAAKLKDSLPEQLRHRSKTGSL